MDVWVVAAAAGAGCVAKFCQILSRDRNQRRCPLRKLVWREKQAEKNLDMIHHLAEMSDNFEKTESPFSIEDLMNKENANFSHSIPPENQVEEIGFSCSSSGKKRSLRYKACCSQMVKPVITSFESCLLSMEQAATEDHMLTFLHSLSSPTLTPLIATNKLPKKMKNTIDGSFMFCLGILIGIVLQKKEVNKLTEMLTHTENLVQDLQEELEMKDSLTVMELNDENLEPPIVFTPQENMVKSRKYDDNISNIEEELKVELERLELKIGVVTDENDSTRYAVSPVELTLRLHEVIQSRLEERVVELEAALDISQKKVRSMELDRIKSQNYFLNNNNSNRSLFSSISVVTDSEEDLDDVSIDTELISH